MLVPFYASVSRPKVVMCRAGSMWGRTVCTLMCVPHSSSGSVLEARELVGGDWHATVCRDTDCHAQLASCVMTEPLKGQPAMLGLLCHSCLGQGTLLVPNFWGQTTNEGNIIVD